jgi:NAD(P)-dependent dehydrogenase (short-subunit alcohol dehydrogenase family)
MGRHLVHRAGLDDIGALDRASPYGRLCQPEDVSDVVRFLVSDAAGYVTGQTIIIDGGADSAAVVSAARMKTEPST